MIQETKSLFKSKGSSENCMILAALVTEIFGSNVALFVKVWC